MKKSEKFIYFYFLLLPFIDLLTSLMVRFTNLSITPGIIIKSITLIIGLIYIIFFSKSKFKKKTIVYLLLLVLFGIIYFISKNYSFNFGILLSEAKYVFKYFYFPVVLCFMINVIDDLKLSKKLIIKILVSNAIIYTILMMIPYLTSTGFNSYDIYWINEGITGWFYAANEIGAILTILSISIYFIMNYYNKKIIFVILPLMISLAIIGTKVSFLGLITMTIMCVIASILNGKKKALVQCSIVLVFLCISMFFSPVFNNFVSSNDNFINNELPTIDVNKDDLLNIDIDGKISSSIQTIKDLIPIPFIAHSLKRILSSRDLFLINNLNVYLNSNLEDKLLGLGWEDRPEINYTLSNKLIEIDVADIFIHYGIVGFIVYFLPLLYCFVLGIKNIKYFTTETWLSSLTFMFGICISLFAGHILSAPTVSIYLVLLLGLSMITIRDKKEAK